MQACEYFIISEILNRKKEKKDVNLYIYIYIYIYILGVVDMCERVSE